MLKVKWFGVRPRVFFTAPVMLSSSPSDFVPGSQSCLTSLSPSSEISGKALYQCPNVFTRPLSFYSNLLEQSFVQYLLLPKFFSCTLFLFYPTKTLRSSVGTFRFWTIYALYFFMCCYNMPGYSFSFRGKCNQCDHCIY